MPERRRKRAHWFVTLLFLRRINELGLARPSDLYPIVRSQANLDRWLWRLEEVARLVKKVEKKGHKYYKKTEYAHVARDWLEYHSQVLVHLRPILAEEYPPRRVLGVTESGNNRKGLKEPGHQSIYGNFEADHVG